MSEVIVLPEFVEGEDPEALTNKLVDCVVKVIERSAKRLDARLIRHMSGILRGRRLRLQGFEERLYDRWADAIDLYELCLYLAQECGHAFNKHFHSHAIATKDYKFEALVRLHGAAARIAGEVHKLLLGGYASGAHARWRSLHETAVVALFIAQESNEVAERYFHHQFVKAYEDAQDYQKYAEALGEEKLTPEEMAVIDAYYQSVLRRFGNHFKKNEEYGWALAALETRDPSLKGKRIGIKHLQNAVRIEHWTSLLQDG